MARRWQEVAQSPAFRQLSAPEREAARRQYFDEVVAPKVAANKVDAARVQFQLETKADTGLVEPKPAPFNRAQRDTEDMGGWLRESLQESPNQTPNAFLDKAFARGLSRDQAKTLWDRAQYHATGNDRHAPPKQISKDEKADRADYTLGELGRDVAASGAAALTSTAQLGYELADLATRPIPGGTSLDDVIDLRARFANTQKLIRDDLHTSEFRAKQQKLRGATKDGFFETVRTVISDPVLLGDVLIQAVPYAMGFAGLARGAFKLGLKKAADKGLTGDAAKQYAQKRARNTLIGANMAVEGAAGSMQARQQVYGTDRATLAASPVYSDYREQGMGHEEAVDKLADRASLIAAMVAAPIAGGASLLTAGMEARFFTGMVKKAGGVVPFAMGVGGGLVKEAGEEAIQEGGSKFAANIGALLSGANPEQEPFEGVPGAAGIGAVAGGVTGAGIGLLGQGAGALQRRIDKKTRDTESASARADAALDKLYRREELDDADSAALLKAGYVDTRDDGGLQMTDAGAARFRGIGGAPEGQQAGQGNPQVNAIIEKTLRGEAPTAEEVTALADAGMVKRKPDGGFMVLPRMRRRAAKLLHGTPEEPPTERAQPLPDAWQQTRARFYADPDNSGFDHGQVVAEALEQGRPVAPDVLVDYPELIEQRQDDEAAAQDADTDVPQNVAEEGGVTAGRGGPNRDGKADGIAPNVAAARADQPGTGNEQPPSAEAAPAGPDDGPATVDTTEGDQTTNATAGKPVVELPVEQLQLSDEVPQFKGGASVTGEVEPLQGGFDRRGLAPIQVWRRENGEMEIISGRHRWQHARRNRERTIPAQVYNETDGFTQAMAASLDAELNIRDGQGEVKDYVQYFQTPGFQGPQGKAEAESRGLLARATGKRAYAIATSGTAELVAAHSADQISDQAAVEIAQASPNNERLQALGMQGVGAGQSIAQAVNTMRAVEALGGGGASEQGDIFGFDDSAMREAREMARVATARQREIRERIASVRGAAKRPDKARELGVDVADPEGVNRRIEELADEARRWDNWHTDPDLVARVRAQLRGEPIEESAEEVIDEAPPGPGLFDAGEASSQAEAAETQAGQDDFRLAAQTRSDEQLEDDERRQAAAAQTDAFGGQGAAAQEANTQQQRQRAAEQPSAGLGGGLFGATPAPEAAPSDTQPPEYGQGNKVFTQDAAAAARERLRAKLGRVNAGFDPELLQDGVALAGYHIEAGARSFAKFSKAMIDDLGEAVRPYLKYFYNAVRDFPGFDAADMDDRETVDAAGASPTSDAGRSSAAEDEAAQDERPAFDLDTDDPAQFTVMQAAHQLLSDDKALPQNRNELKRWLASLYRGVAPKDIDNAQLKRAQEQLEAGIAMHLRVFYAEQAQVPDVPERMVFAAFVDLYDNQPPLNIRTSTSVADQAYSTPAPLAWLAASASGALTTEKTVLEPTAGTGMLLIGQNAAAEKGATQTNEINDYRARLLRAQGFEVSQADAAAGVPGSGYGVVVSNPPFGSLMQATGQKAKSFDGFKLVKIDHVIAANALEAMADDGTATLIIAANKTESERGEADRIFYNWLYSHYDVADHYELNGDMYAKQGAGWPVAVVTVKRRREAQVYAPDAASIPRYNSWDDAYDHYRRWRDGKQRATGLGAGDRAPGGGVASPGRDRPQPRNDNRQQPGPVADGQAPGPDRGGSQPGASGRPGNPNAGQPGADLRQYPGRTGQQPGPAPGDARVDLGDRLGDESAERGPGRRASVDPRPKSDGNTGTADADDGGLTASEFQVAYRPQSAGGGDDILIPRNLVSPTQRALERLDARVGGIDAFVMDRLGYASLDALYEAFMGVQIDAIAASIDQIEQGKGVVIADQCVSGDTRIYDPASGTHTAIKALAEAGKPIDVLALTPDGLRSARACAPFKKGQEHLYRVTLATGRQITVTGGHRFLHPDGWRHVVDDSGRLAAGHSLACAEGPRLNNLGYSRIARAEDEPHWKKTPQDCLDDCSAGSYSCGGLSDSQAVSPDSPAQPLYPNNSWNEYTGWDTVTSVEYAGFGDYYDMWVPGHENYVAEGLVNHNTGLGKGRQAAAVLRYAKQQGLTPVFITEKADLFTAMFDDMGDIGSSDFRPFLMNAGAYVQDQTGSRRFTLNGPQRDAGVARMLAGDMPAGANAIFATYSQFRVDNRQRQAVSALADNAVLVLDESHNAAGNSNTGEYLRDVIAHARGVTYLSATYAKRPDSMPLYHKTDLGVSVDDIETLIAAMEAGGVPLQTVVSNMLAASGQLFRRERSYQGVEIRTEVDGANREAHERISDAVTRGLRAIVTADRAFHAMQVKAMDKQAKAEAKRISGGGNRASAGVSHTAFTSVVHNIISQMLLAVKANTAADAAIAAIRAGRKPIIGLENTLGSFLKAYADDNGIADGDSLEGYDFRAVLLRSLDRSRVIRVTDVRGNEVSQAVPLDELTPSVRVLYDRASAAIESIEPGTLDALAASPIDWIRHRINQAGYTVKEITGRDRRADYSDPANPVLSHIPAEEKNKVTTRDEFNGGKLDALVINVSGATGISLHASENFADQRQRHMIIAQAPRDINVFVQMLGRIHRTGQVVLPRYAILTLDLPTEKRPTAVLARKMKSLNANTTANDESETSVEAQDILNKYGDRVVAEYLREDRTTREFLGIEGADNTESPPENLAMKATGRLALMSIDDQRAFYQEVEANYASLIEYLDKTGQNDLQVQTLDLDARAPEDVQRIVEGAGGDTPFGADANLGLFNIKAQGDPPTWEEVQAAVSEALGGRSPQDVVDQMIARRDALFAPYAEQARQAVARAEQATGEAGTDKQAAAATDSLEKAKARVEDEARAAQTHRELLRLYLPGAVAQVTLDDQAYTGIVIRVKDLARDNGRGNPYALSKTQVTFMVDGGIRSITVPMTRLTGAGSIADARTRNMLSPEEAFDQAANRDEREMRWIATGNLLAGMGELQRGQIASYTTADDTIEQGIVLPKSFDPAENLRGDQIMRSPDAIWAFLRENRDHPEIGRFGVATRTALDGKLGEGVRVVPSDNGIKIQVPKSKAKGGEYYLNKALLEHTGDFVAIGSRMQAEVTDPEAAKRAIAAMLEKKPLYAPESYAAQAKAANERFATDARFSRAPAGFAGIDTQADTGSDAFAPGSPQDVAALAPLAAVLEREHGRHIALDPVRPRLSGGGARARRLQAFVNNAFGRKIVWFRSDDPLAPQGVTLASTSDRIFVNAGATHPAERVAGHEMVHAIRLAAPEIYEALASAVAGVARGRGRYGERIRAVYAADGLPVPSDAAIDEEMVADMVGAFWQEPGFMREIAARTEPGVFKRLANQVLAWLDRVAARLAGRPRSAFIDRHASNADAVRRALLDALADFARQRAITARPSDHPLVQFMVAWHGSPHDFAEFSMGAIGTGERVQAYGWGLYFTSKRQIAEHYRKALSEETLVFPSGEKQRTQTYGDFDRLQALLVAALEKGPNNNTRQERRVAAAILTALEESDGRVNILDGAEAYLERESENRPRELLQIGATQKEARAGGAYYREGLEALRQLRQSGLRVEAGRTYRVNIAPDESEFLAWDALLDEQPGRVLAKLRSTEYWEFAEERIENAAAARGDNPAGDDVYRDLMEDMTPQEASEFLSSIGIPGIKYLDGSSRGKTEGGYNYVLFDDSLVQVDAKYMRSGQGFGQAQQEAPTTRPVGQLYDATGATYDPGTRVRLGALRLQGHPITREEADALENTGAVVRYTTRGPDTTGEQGLFAILNKAPMVGGRSGRVHYPTRATPAQHGLIDRIAARETVEFAPVGRGGKGNWAYQVIRPGNEPTPITPEGDPLFSRSNQTQRDYERRIDALYRDNAQASRMGAKVLDRSDVLGLLGYPDIPVHLNESEVIEGRYNHHLTAEDWKKVPEWLENPAAVFDSDTVPGALVFLAPEPAANGAPIVITVKPNDRLGRMDVHLLTNAYDKDSGRMPVHKWINKGLTRFYDARKSLSLGTTTGLQLPRVVHPAKGADKRIYGPKLLRKYRQQRDARTSRSATPLRPADPAHLARLQQALDKPLTLLNRRIPVEIVDASPAAYGYVADAEGVYHNGRIILFARNLPDATRAKQVLRHEAFGHFGMQQILGDRFRPTLARVRELIGSNAEVAGIAQQVRERYDVGKPNGLDENSDTFIEEVIAAMAENKVDLPVLRRILGEIRAFLRRLGLYDQDITRDELYALIGQAGRFAYGQGRVPAVRASAAVFSESVPTFYSGMARVLAEKLPGKAPAARMKQAIEAFARKGQIKQEEMEWSGILGWIDEQGGTVTKAELLEAFAERTVRLEETMLGGGAGPSIEQWLEESNAGVLPEEGGYGAYFDGGKIAEIFETESDAWEALRNEAREYLAHGDIEPQAGTKFEGYTLPGGTNYRELLIRLPVSKELPQGFEARQMGNGRWGVFGPGPLEENRYGAGNTRAEAVKAFGGYGHNGPVYKSTHFDEPNILVHVRFNERTDADGNRVLFIEELQSDWAKEGRERGYKGEARAVPDGIGGYRAVDQNGNDMLNAYNMPISAAYPESVLAQVATGVANAPFKKTYPLLAFKRMIRYAADNGFDKIAWTTGEQQADRYDLSKHVDSIRVKPWIGVSSGVRRYTLDAMGADGNVIFSNTGIEVDELEGTVGKELAEKAETMPADQQAVWSGVDLRFGGTGMQAFYDRMLPNMVGKYIKKWGGKVSSAEVSTEPDGASAGGLYEFSDWMQRNNRGGDPAQLWRESAPVVDEFLASVSGRPVAAHAFGITDPMREAARAGQPLFSRPIRLPQTLLNGRLGQVPEGSYQFDSLPGDAAGLLGFDLGVPYVQERITEKDDKGEIVISTAPMQYDYGRGVIVVNGANPPTDRVVAALYALEETLHAMDHVGTRNALSLGAATLAPGGAIREQAEAHEGDLSAFLSYPLEGDFSEARIQTELFARLGTLYLSNPEALKETMPHAYDAFHRIFRIESAQYPDQTELRGKIRSFAGRRNEMRHPNRTVAARAGRYGNGREDWRADPELARLHGDIAQALGADRLGKRVPADSRAQTRPVSRGEARLIGRDAAGNTQAAATVKDGEWLIVSSGGGDLLGYGIKRAKTRKRAEQLMAAEGLTVALEPPGAQTQVQAQAPLNEVDVLAAGYFGEIGYWLQYQAQDKFNDLTRLKAEAEKAGEEVSDRSDVRLQERLFHGRSRHAMDVFNDKHVEPLLDQLQKTGFRLDALTDYLPDLDADLAERFGHLSAVDAYLYARHAPEANAKLAEINPGEDAMSGMSDADAARLIAALDAKGEGKALREAARRVDAMLAAQRELLVASGLEKKATIGAWEAMYQHYVPLKGSPGGKADSLLRRLIPRSGRGFDTRGKHSKRRLGRKSPARDILANVVAGQYATIRRAEKNAVGRSMLRFAQEHVNDDLWTVNQPMMKRALDPVTGLVTMMPDPAHRNEDNVFIVRVNGVEHHIEFNENSATAVRLVKQLKNMGEDQVGQVLGIAHVLNRYLSLMSTSANPEFVLSNFSRDLQTAVINLNDTQAKKLKRRIIKDAINGKAMGAIWRHQSGQRDGEWVQAFEDFQADGAKTGWMEGYENMDAFAKRLQSRLGRNDPGTWAFAKRSARNIYEFIDRYNTVAENAVRLSAYKHARENGVSRQRAAAMAKTLTVDFNVKGSAGNAMNALYLFYNASIQGSARIITAAARSKQARRWMYGVVAYGIAQELLAHALAGDDEDGRNRYDKIPEYVKRRNLVFMLPPNAAVGDWAPDWMLGPNGDYLMFPMPYGYNVLHYAGQKAGRAMMAAAGGLPGYDPLAEATDLGLSVFDAFNPVGGTASLYQLVSPTIFDPAIQWAENKNFAGIPIHKEASPYGPAPPNYTLHFSGARAWSRWVTEKLNMASGGTEVRPGSININPELIDHFSDFFTGGVGTFVAETADLPRKLFEVSHGNAVNAYEIPFLGKLYGTPRESDSRNLFYDRRSALRYLEQEYALARGNRDAERVRELRQEFPGQTVMLRRMDRAGDVLRNLNQVEDRIKVSGLPDAAKDKRLDAIDKKQQAIFHWFNKQYDQRVVERAQ